jgi:hypothetical protein
VRKSRKLDREESEWISEEDKDYYNERFLYWEE